MKNPTPATRTQALDQAESNYHFLTTWEFPHTTCAEVYHILEDVDALPGWWPSVYLDARVREKGQPGGIGKLVELYTKGWLPYTLRWSFRVTAADFPHGFALQASGDFIGEGLWHFEQRDSTCIVTYDWKISAAKPLLRRLTWLLRSIFSANHEWAMRMGRLSLDLELRRRRGEQNVPPPPGPTWPHNWVNNRVLGQ